MSGAALTHRGKGLAPSPRGGLPLFTTLFTKLATRHVLAILNTIPAISKRVRGNIRILCSNDCLCLSRSLGSLICCLVGLSFSTPFLDLLPQPLGWAHSVFTALILQSGGTATIAVPQLSLDDHVS
jgi:hypothetical protein